MEEAELPRSGHTTVDWDVVFGSTEYRDGVAPINHIRGVGPLFVNDHAAPRQGPQFTQRVQEAASCDSVQGKPANQWKHGFTPAHFASCFLGDGGLLSSEMRTTPAKARVRKRVAEAFGSEATPIALFNIHLWHEEGNFGDRKDQIDGFIDKAKNLLREDPWAFNSSGADWASHEGNRRLQYFVP
jgi:hypothetical protein